MNTQLELSLLFDLRGANGSMGFGEHSEQGHRKSPSRRLLSEDLDLDAVAATMPWTASILRDGTGTVQLPVKRVR
jgi:hypothetical protein